MGRYRHAPERDQRKADEVRGTLAAGRRRRKSHPAENVALQLERRVAFRRVIKRSISFAQKFGAEGIKISCAGRLGGAEIARTEWVREGRVPLHTLRADIDYGRAVANTTYGVIGVKVWIFKGEILHEGSRAC